VLTLIHRLPTAQGFGELLAQGSKRAAEKIAGMPCTFRSSARARNLPCMNRAAKWNVGMGYAISEIGADHPGGGARLDALQPESLSFKAAQILGVKQPCRRVPGPGQDGAVLHHGALEQL